MEHLKRINYQWQFTLLFVLVSVVLATLSMGILSYYESHLRTALNKKEAVAELGVRKEIMRHDYERFEATLNAIVQDGDFKIYLDNPDNTRENHQAQTFQILMASHPDMMQLSYLDNNGKEKIRLDRKTVDANVTIAPHNQLQDKSKRDFFKKTLSKEQGEIYISPLDLRIEHAKLVVPYEPVIRLSIPVFSHGKHNGIVLINLFMSQLIKKIVDSSSFYFYIYDQDGYVLVCNDKHVPNWSRFIANKSYFDKNTLLDSVVLKDGLDSQTLYLGMQAKVSEPFLAKDMKNMALLLSLLIIPLSLFLGYFLAKIPKHLFDEIEEREQAMIQQSKMAAMGEMIGAIAHQWRQPLNAVGVLAQEIEFRCEYGNIEKEELKTLGNQMQEYLEYMSKTIDDFRDFFKPSKQKTIFDVTKAINKSLKLVAKQFETHNVTVNLELSCQECHYEVDGYESEFRQVIINLLNNAREAIETHIKQYPDSLKIITITVEQDNGEISIKVKDTGGGVPANIIDKIFDIYVSTKYEQQGTGLGLYMSKLIIERNMLGKLSVHNTNEGAEFEIKLFMATSES